MNKELEVESSRAKAIIAKDLVGRSHQYWADWISAGPRPLTMLPKYPPGSQGISKAGARRKRKYKLFAFQVGKEAFQGEPFFRHKHILNPWSLQQSKPINKMETIIKSQNSARRSD